MSDAPKRYQLAFLTDQWEWEVDFDAPSLDRAKAMSRRALEDLVEAEAPQLACATLLDGEAKVGVWDWVQGQAHWTPL